MVEMARFIKPILAITPPDLTSLDPRPMMPLAGLARRFQQLPQRQQAVFVQLMTMSASDFLDQWFETDPLKATMSASGIIGTYQGVKSPGTAYVLLHHYMGEIDGAFRAWGIPKGGTGGVSNAIGNAARALGAEIRTEAPVANVIVKGGRAVGVALESGEEIHADSILLVARLEPDVPRACSSRARSTRRSRRRSGASSSAARRARSTSRSTGCPTSAACRAPASTCAARSASARRSTRWSGPTTTRSTAASAASRTST